MCLLPSPWRRTLKLLLRSLLCSRCPRHRQRRALAPAAPRLPPLRLHLTVVDFLRLPSPSLVALTFSGNCAMQLFSHCCVASFAHRHLVSLAFDIVAPLPRLSTHAALLALSPPLPLPCTISVAPCTCCYCLAPSLHHCCEHNTPASISCRDQLPRPEHHVCKLVPSDAVGFFRPFRHRLCLAAKYLLDH
ncbi:hypothetical protein VPH35_072830 [Triticum aestivum]